jgi:hypothetical protein
MRAEFKTVVFKEGEWILESGMCISNIAAALRSLGGTCDDEKVVRKKSFLLSQLALSRLPSRLRLLDLSTLTAKEVTGHLCAIDSGW